MLLSLLVVANDGNCWKTLFAVAIFVVAKNDLRRRWNFNINLRLCKLAGQRNCTKRLFSFLHKSKRK